MVEMHPSGNYAIISGPVKDNNALLIHEGIMEVLKPHIDEGKIDIVLDQHAAEWIELSALSIVVDFLQDNPDTKIDAILAGNDNLAGGALEALGMLMMDETPLLAGQDAEMKALTRIQEGSQTLTLHKSISKLLNLTVDVATHENVKKEPVILNDYKPEYVNNGKKDVFSYILEPVLVTKENVNEVINSKKNLTENN